MLAAILGFFLNLAGSSVVDKVLGHLEKKADTETERQRIATLREKGLADNARDVVIAGMGHKAFWIPWLMAAVPLAAWFGWGVLDTLANGALPDVATLPPQLKAYADVVWSNIFYSGAAVGGAQVIASAIARRK